MLVAMTAAPLRGFLVFLSPQCFLPFCNIIFIIADPTFDLLPPVKDCQPPIFHAEPAVCQNSGHRPVYNADMSCQRTSSKKWGSDVSGLMSSDQWLKTYGLKAAKLDMNYLLRQISFRHSDGKHSCYLG